MMIRRMVAIHPNHQLKTVVNIPLFIGFQPSKVVVFRISLAHPQYDDTVNQKHDRAVEKPTLPKLTKTDQNRP